MKQTVLLLVALTFLTIQLAGKPKLAVMSVDDKTGNLTDKMKNAAVTLLRMYLSSSGEYVVIDRSRQAATLKDIIKQEKKESYKKCYDSSCQIPLGQALSADTILRTTITELGGVHSFGVELVDLAKEATVAAANAEFDGTEKGMRSTIKKVVSDLTGSTLDDATVKLSVGDVTMQSLRTFDVKKRDDGVSDADTDLLVAFDAALKIEKTDDIRKKPLKAIHAWEKVTGFTENNPYMETADKRLAEWKQYYDSKRQFEEQYRSDSDKVSDVLPLSVIPYKQKRKLVLSFIDTYAPSQGTREIMNIVRSAAPDPVMKMLNGDSVITKKIRNTAQSLCEKNRAGECMVLAEMAGDPIDLKKPWLKKACAADDQNACKSYAEIQKTEKQAKLQRQLMEQKAQEKKQRKAQKKREREFTKSYHAAGKSRRVRGWVTFLSGIAVSSAGCAMFGVAKGAKNNWDTAYEKYLTAETEDAALSYRNDVETYRDRERNAAIAGSVLLGIGASAMATGIVLWNVESRAEKKVKKEFEISFHADPFTRTAGITLRY